MKAVHLPTGEFVWAELGSQPDGSKKVSRYHLLAALRLKVREKYEKKVSQI